MSRAASKREKEEDRLDRVFHALSHRTRRAMLVRLSRGPAIVRELAEPFEMSMPAVCKHLRVLEEVDLVERTVDGRVHRCVLEAEPLRHVETWLAHYRPFWTETLDGLARYVERDPRKERHSK